jgi:acyl carrier protein
MLQQVRSLVAAVLGIENPQSIHPQHGFSELGMDSLTAMDLKEKLQAQFDCVLYSTVVFDHPTLASLARYLEQQVGGETGDRPNPDAATVPTDPPAPDLAPEPSLDEIADLLAEKLASLQRGNAP